MARHIITLIPGDGIGPEVTEATRRIIDAAGASIAWEVCEAGANVFKKGLSSGVPQETIESIQRNKVALKGPLETPVGYGEKSANVTLRKFFELFGNVRPIRQFVGVPSLYSAEPIDFVIVRENVEDLYAGIEYMQTPGVAQGLKIISRKGCEKIVRLAFEYARAYGRKRVTCVTKANIMKLTEGLLKKTFEEIAPEYGDILADHMIVDNCGHQMVKRPGQFDVLVSTNMNGDILSDVGSALIGGLGFAPGANLGTDFAIFEAVHGSAPKYAGKNTINPTAVLMSGIMMLQHIGEFEAANAIEQALCVTLEEGKHPLRDMVGNAVSVSTTTYTDAIIANLGRTSASYKPRACKAIKLPNLEKRPDFVQAKNVRILGVDISVQSKLPVNDLGKSLEEIFTGTPFLLKMISNRGVQVYPNKGVVPDVVDYFQCRVLGKNVEASLSLETILTVLSRVSAYHAVVNLQLLQEFDGKPGFTKMQGED